MAGQSEFTDYEGRRMRGPDGNVYVVRNGKPIPAEQSLAGPERDQVASERAKLNVARELARLGRDFEVANQKRGTGGPGSAPLLPDWWQPNKQRMRGISAEMVRANIQPGTSGSANSNAEQQLLAVQYPSLDTDGEINQQRIRVLEEMAHIRGERVKAMDEWVRTRGSLNQFEENWAPREQALRTQYRQRIQGRPGAPVVPGAGRGRRPGADGVIDLDRR